MNPHIEKLLSKNGLINLKPFVPIFDAAILVINTIIRRRRILSASLLEDGYVYLTTLAQSENKRSKKKIETDIYVHSVYDKRKSGHGVFSFGYGKNAYSTRIDLLEVRPEENELEKFPHKFLKVMILCHELTHRLHFIQNFQKIKRGKPRKGKSTFHLNEYDEFLALVVGVPMALGVHLYYGGKMSLEEYRQFLVNIFNVETDFPAIRSPAVMEALMKNVENFYSFSQAMANKKRFDVNISYGQTFDDRDVKS